MRRLMAIGWLMLACGASCAEDIGSVLRRSQQQRLDRIEPADADSADAQRVRDSFALLLKRPSIAHPSDLRVSRSTQPLAETLRGDVVVASATLGDLPEAERLFILAHELGHVALGHWSQMGLLFQKWVPGEVTQQETDAVADALGAEASRLAHQQEYEADAFALRLLRGMGLPRDEVLAVFKTGGLRPDTPTHPGSRRRHAALLAIDAVDADTRASLAALQAPR